VTLGFPIEHPIDSIKTQWQAKPYLKNELQIVKYIYNEKGWRGFYAGALPNLTRCIVRNSYKYPLLIMLPEQFNIIENPHTRKYLTGLTIAFVEATITCPLERLKVYFMTSSQSQSYRSFFNSIRQNAFRELFRGFTPLFMRQFVSWTTMLQTDLVVKSFIRQRLGLTKEDKIKPRWLIPASVVVALVNTSLVMPLDVVKTHMEKKEP
jgi:hypothetical protein